MNRRMADLVATVGAIAMAAVCWVNQPARAASTAPAPAAPGPATPIKIGSFLSLTGSAAYLGDPEDKTLRLYVADINAQGGVLGRHLDLIVYDDGDDSNKARTFGKRLIEEDNVDILIGGTTTASTMAVVPLVEEAHIPFLSLAGAVVIIDPVKKWVFKTGHTDLMACQKIFQDLAKRGATKIALLSGSEAFGKSMHDRCTGVAPNYDIQIVADESYDVGAADLTAQFAKIGAARGVQALVIPGFGKEAAAVVRAYQRSGMTLPLYESHGVASRQFIDLAGSAAEGVRLPAAALMVANLLPDSDPQKPVLLDYKRHYEKRWNSAVSTFGGHAYDALLIAVAAMKRAGTTDKAAVRDEIEKTRGYIGTAGTVNMSPTDHLGLDISAFRLLEIRNGGWTLLN